MREGRGGGGREGREGGREGEGERGEGERRGGGEEIGCLTERWCVNCFHRNLIPGSVSQNMDF